MVCLQASQCHKLELKTESQNMTHIRLTHTDSGEALGQRYTVLRQLREEPWGNVWLAQDRLLNTEVALKIFLKETNIYSQGREILIQEAALAIKLRHPKMLAVFHGGEANEGFFLVLEPFPGETLLSHLTRHHRLPLAQALQVLEDVSQAVAFAHKQRVVHQSLDPLHVLIEGEQVKVANWAGKPEDSEQAAYLELKAYLPPEVIHGEGVSPAGNVFSLAVLGFRLLAGSLPYSLTFDEPFPYRLEGPPLDLDEIPIPLQNLLLQCLAPEPEERLPDASAFLASLEQNRELWRSTPQEKWFPWQAGKTDKVKASVKKATSFLKITCDQSKPLLLKSWHQAKLLGGKIWETLTNLKGLWRNLPSRLSWGLVLGILAVVTLVGGYFLVRRSVVPPATKPSSELPSPRLPLEGGPPKSSWDEPTAAPKGAVQPHPGAVSLPTPPRQPAERRQSLTSKRFWVLVASYARPDQAQALSERLKKQNFAATMVKTTPKGKSLYLVRIGPLTSQQAAAEIARRLKSQTGLVPKITPEAPAAPRKPVPPGSRS